MHQKFRQILDLLVEQETVEHEYCPDLLAQYQKDIVKSGKKYPEDVWEVLRNGTEDEFTALINCVTEIGEEFDSDAGCKKIINIARNRGTNTSIEAVKFAFPKRFDKFWNDPEPAEPVGIARTFGQIINKQPV